MKCCSRWCQTLLNPIHLSLALHFLLSMRFAEGFLLLPLYSLFFHLLSWNRGFLWPFLNFVLEQGGHCSKWNRVKFSLENDMMLSNFSSLHILPALAPENSQVISFWQHLYSALNKFGLIRVGNTRQQWPIQHFLTFGHYCFPLRELSEALPTLSFPPLH